MMTKLAETMNSVILEKNIENKERATVSSILRNLNENGKHRGHVSVFIAF